jgi:hypothetical protein
MSVGQFSFKHGTGQLKIVGALCGFFDSAKEKISSAGRPGTSAGISRANA